MAGHGVETKASDSKCNEWQRANSCFVRLTLFIALLPQFSCKHLSYIVEPSSQRFGARSVSPTDSSITFKIGASSWFRSTL